MWRRLAPACVVAMLAVAGAQCEVASDTTFSQLTVEGFGSAYFPQFQTDRANDRIVFFGGVCVTGQGWTLLAEQVVLEGLSDIIMLRASEPELFVPGFVLQGSLLRADRQTLTVDEATFEGQTIAGSAERVVYDIIGESFHLARPRFEGEGFRIYGSAARLSDTRLVVEEAVGTTCLCDGSPFYTVRSSRADIDISQFLVVLENGEVTVAGLSLGLEPETAIAVSELGELKLPLAISFDADDPDDGEVGRGLGVVVGALELAEGTSGTFGIHGLDGDHPLEPELLLLAEDEGASVRFGFERGGWLSDIEVVRALNRWLRAVFAVRNLNSAEAGFLHEGSLQLAAEIGLPVPAGFRRVTVRASGVAAASSQALPTQPVTDARLGGTVGISAVLAPAPFGRLSVQASAGGTYYPGAARWQYRVGVRPAWMLDVAAGTVEAVYSRVWTNGASPFTVKVDRLEPENELRLRYDLTHAGTDFTVAATVRSRYSFLPGEGFRELRSDVSLAVPQSFGRVEAAVALEFAGLLATDTDIEAFVEAEVGVTVDAAAGPAEFAVRARYQLLPPAGLDSLEVAVSYPVDGRDVTVTPFLALELVPLLEGGSPSISGHGLEVLWHTCCGTLALGYRQERSVFAARLGFTVATAPSGNMAP